MPLNARTLTLLLLGVPASFAANLAHAVEDATSTLVNVELADGLIEEVQAALPESVDVNQEFLNPTYDPNVYLQQEAHVSVTFLDEGAGYRNSLGYFTFSADTFDGMSFADIDTDGSGNISVSELNVLNGVETGMIFNNSSEAGGGGSLYTGDTVGLGGTSITDINGTDYTMTGGTTFEAGTYVGFFLLQNAWSGGEVAGMDNNLDPLTFYTVDFLNPENSPDATIDDAAENSRHVAMMYSTSGENELILGFEDLYRDERSDEDFNDAVFRIRTDPVEALYADVATTQQVIELQAAPSPVLGAGLPGLVLLGLIIGGSRRRKHV